MAKEKGKNIKENESSEKDLENSKKNSEKEASKAIYLFLGLLVAFLTFMILFPIFKQEMNVIKYEGLTFTKTKFGEIPVYYYYYNFEDKEGGIRTYNLYLRTDPRDNEVPVNGEIVYPSMGHKIYVSINFDESFKCDNATREISTLGMFLGGNMYNVVGAVGNEDYALKNNITFANCNSRNTSTVIEVWNTDKTEINQINEKCYKIEAASCSDLLLAIEKFEVQSIIDAKERAQDTTSISSATKQDNGMVLIKSYNLSNTS